VRARTKCKLVPIMCRNNDKVNGYSSNLCIRKLLSLVKNPKVIYVINLCSTIPIPDKINKKVARVNET
jgi:hypothetical protein